MFDVKVPVSRLRNSHQNYDEQGNLWTAKVDTHHVTFMYKIHTKEKRVIKQNNLKRNHEGEWRNIPQKGNDYQGGLVHNRWTGIPSSASLILNGVIWFFGRTKNLTHTGWIGGRGYQRIGTRIRGERFRLGVFIVWSRSLPHCCLLYYEEIKREIKRILIYECRCNERLKS